MDARFYAAYSGKSEEELCSKLQRLVAQLASTSERKRNCVPRSQEYVSVCRDFADLCREIANLTQFIEEHG